MEITKREVLVSIIIVILMAIFGILIHGQIKQKIDDQNAIYNKAVKIDDETEFKYGMKTSIGNAFVFGTLEAVDTVTYPEISGSYIRVEKTTERWTRHTRTVTHTDSKGNTYTTTEVYYTWDVVNRDLIHASKIKFLNVVFSYEKMNISTEHYIDTLYRSGTVRDIYYGTDTQYIGTIFTRLADNTISDHTNFYEGRTIEETNKDLQSTGFWLWIFWIVWIAITSAIVYGFFYLDNRYLEN